MSNSERIIGSLDATMVMLCVAGGLAAIFILAILFDAFRPSRRRLRKLARSASASAETDSLMGRIRLLHQTLESESARRRRKAVREREESK